MTVLRTDGWGKSQDEGARVGASGRIPRLAPCFDFLTFCSRTSLAFPRHPSSSSCCRGKDVPYRQLTTVILLLSNR